MYHILLMADDLGFVIEFLRYVLIIKKGMFASLLLMSHMTLYRATKYLFSGTKEGFNINDLLY